MTIFSLTSLIAAITCAALGFIVFLKKPRSSINRSFAVETFFISIWTLFPFLTGRAASHESALFSARLVYMSAILVPPTFLLFVLNLIDAAGLKKERQILRALYLCTIAFLLFSFRPVFIRDISLSGPVHTIEPGMLYHVFFLYFGLTIAYGYMKIYLQYRSASGHKRNQLLFILISFLIAGTAGLIHFLSAYGVREVFPHDVLVILYTGIISYAIIRYRAMEVNIIIGKTMAYSLSVGLLTGLFVVLVLAISNLFSAVANISSFKVNIAAAILIALLFNPLRNRIQKVIDRVFFKKSYDYYVTIRNVSHELASMFEKSEIYRFVGSTILSSLGLGSICLFDGSPGKGYEVSYREPLGGDGSRKEDSPGNRVFAVSAQSHIVKVCDRRREALTMDMLREESLGLSQDADPEGLKNELILFRGEALVPFFVDEELRAFIILGEKRSGDVFSEEDISLLNTIANQTSIALKNAEFYRDKIHSERLASIGMMSATFAHEIRNPLTSLKTFAQLMPEKYNDEEFRNTFSRIVVGEIERIDGLIKDLLDFSSQRKAPRLKNFDLVSLVDHTVNYVARKLEIQDSSIRIVKAYDEAEINLSGDAEKLKQTFINILMNGCQAMNGSGTLTVSVGRNKNHAEVSIADTGKGIHPDQLSRIFDPFVTNKEMGVGLGLAISKRVVEDHNGRIEVESEVARGSTFRVLLPVQN